MEIEVIKKMLSLLGFKQLAMATDMEFRFAQSTGNLTGREQAELTEKLKRLDIFG